MAATIWDTSVRASIAERAQQVSAHVKPGWGKMNVTPATTLGEHPAFGDLSYDAYGCLIAKHTDHHLRQFGV